MESMKFAKPEEIVTEEGYTLAPFLLRIASSAIDAAFFIASFWLIFFFSYQTNWYPTLDDAFQISSSNVQMVEYQKLSGLVTIKEDGSIADIKSDNYEDYLHAIHDYYFVWNALDNAKNPDPKDYGVKDWNVTVLGLPEDVSLRNNSKYYEFQTNAAGKPIDTEEGVLKATLYKDPEKKDELTDNAKAELKTYFQKAYYATQKLLLSEPYYVALQHHVSNGLMVVLSLAIFIPFLIFYFVLPMFSRLNQTLGKRFMHLMVIDYRGKPLNKWFLSLRALPFLLTAIMAILLDSMVISLTIALVVFMVSWACATFTKKKRALHDFVALSCVAREDETYLIAAKEVEEETEDAQNR